MTYRRHVPGVLWCRIMSRLPKSAIDRGDRTGYPVAQYQTDRDAAGPAFDAALAALVDDLAHELMRRLGEGSIVETLGYLQRGVDPHLKPAGRRGVRRTALAAARAHETAQRASALARHLSELAEVADTIACGLTLRAEDHAAQQLAPDPVARG